jgi:hypothetical protein
MKQVENWDSLIPSLLALYDLLSDDDEDIRDLAAKTVSSVLKRSLNPPAAREELIKWLKANYNRSSQFLWNLLCRLTGSTAAAPQNSELNALIQPQKQFETALARNNDLFAVEEQNLFEDKAIELALWSGLFRELPLDVFKTSRMDAHKSFMLLEFAGWISNALGVLNKTVIQDGPLGWTSTLLGFTAVLRVLRCANALLDCHHKHFRKLPSAKQPEEQFFLQRELENYARNVVFALQIFRSEAIGKDIHPMLIEEMRGQKLLDPIPQNFMGKISLKMKRIGGVNSDPLSQPLLEPAITAGDRNA